MEDGLRQERNGRPLRLGNEEKWETAQVREGLGLGDKKRAGLKSSGGRSRNLEAEMAILLDLEKPVLGSNIRLYKSRRLLRPCKVVLSL